MEESNITDEVTLILQSYQAMAIHQPFLDRRQLEPTYPLYSLKQSNPSYNLQYHQVILHIMANYRSLLPWKNIGKRKWIILVKVECIYSFLWKGHKVQWCMTKMANLQAFVMWKHNDSWRSMIPMALSYKNITFLMVSISRERAGRGSSARKCQVGSRIWCFIISERLGEGWWKRSRGYLAFSTSVFESISLSEMTSISCSIWPEDR